MKFGGTKTDKLIKELMYVVERNQTEPFLHALLTRARILEKIMRK